MHLNFHTGISHPLLGVLQSCRVINRTPLDEAGIVFVSANINVKKCHFPSPAEASSVSLLCERLNEERRRHGVVDRYVNMSITCNPLQFEYFILLAATTRQDPVRNDLR